MTTLEAVRAFSDEVSVRAAETEAARCVPPDLARRLGAAGVFRMFVPSQLGGDPVDPLTAYAIVTELARADPSTGWTSMILNTTFFSSWLEPEVARAILETEPARRHGGPVRSHWPDGAGRRRHGQAYRPVPVQQRQPARVVVLPGRVRRRSRGCARVAVPVPPAVRRRDPRHLASRRASRHRKPRCARRRVLVPLERTASPIFEQAPHDEPHYRWSFFALLGSLMSGVPIGVARRSLDEFFALAERKSRGGEGSLATEQVTQLAVAHCEGSLRARRASWRTRSALPGTRRSVATTSPETSASRSGWPSPTPCELCLEVVDTVFALAGGGALFDDNPLQRCWRDLHAASSHIFFSTSFVCIWWKGAAQSTGRGLSDVTRGNRSFRVRALPAATRSCVHSQSEGERNRTKCHPSRGMGVSPDRR